jgi:hypothetical protein
MVMMETKMRIKFAGLVLFATLCTLFLRSSASSENKEHNTATPPEIVILTGNPMGGVKFRHRLHTDIREITCVTCHHASRPEKPATAPEQACRSCHVSVPVKPMVTNVQAAFHNADATAGLCISCHRKEDAEHKYKLAPTQCLECHNKANALPDPTAGIDHPQQW